jgi:YidC/Oxa1 family membrane protein insertase
MDYRFFLGGFWFFTDLTVCDEYRYLPVLSFAAFMIAGELGADILGRPVKFQSTYTKWGWRIFRVGFFAFILNDAPAAVHCYWVPNSVLSVVQSTIFAHPAVLKALKIPLPIVKAGHQIYVDEKQYDPDPTRQDLQRNLIPVKLRAAPIATKQNRRKKSRQTKK